MSSNQEIKVPVDKLVALETQRLQNHSKELVLREKNDERNFVLNKLGLEANIKQLENQPTNERKNFNLVAGWGTLFLLILCSFLLASMYLGFSKEVYTIVSYLGTALVSFITGKYQQKAKDKPTAE